MGSVPNLLMVKNLVDQFSVSWGQTEKICYRNKQNLTFTRFVTKTNKFKTYTRYEFYLVIHQQKNVFPLVYKSVCFVHNILICEKRIKEYLKIKEMDEVI